MQKKDIKKIGIIILLIILLIIGIKGYQIHKLNSKDYGDANIYSEYTEQKLSSYEKEFYETLVEYNNLFDSDNTVEKSVNEIKAQIQKNLNNKPVEEQKKIFNDFINTLNYQLRNLDYGLYKIKVQNNIDMFKTLSTEEQAKTQEIYKQNIERSTKIIQKKIDEYFLQNN